MSQAPLYELFAATITGPGGTVLVATDLVVRDQAATVVLGPGGTGKSALLKGLSGRPADTGWLYGGGWRYRGRQLRRHGTAAPVLEISWLPQSRPPANGSLPPTGPAGWSGVFAPGIHTVLLDEPVVSSPDHLEALVSRIRTQVQKGAAVVVTHDISFARVVADDVIMVCANRVVVACEGKSFFDKPPNELAERMIAQGNCWPAGTPPALPSHFHWVLERKLAGLGRPGLVRDLETDLEAIALAGIELLVSLTEEPLPAGRLKAVGIQGRHFPIRDMGVPAVSPTASLCREIERALLAGRPVAVHCQAGMGRTGTILAAVLVWLGMNADQAVDRVRAVARGYIQNPAQIGFVHSFAEAVGPRPGTVQEVPQ